MRQHLSVFGCMLIVLLFLGACLRTGEEVRELTIDEYVLLNLEPPLWLVDIDFSRADLRNIDLADADLRGANLRGANLRGADLNGSSLLYADLRSADLTGVNLSNADLRGANFSGAILNSVTLTNAEYNADTRWGLSFDPEAAGAIRVE
jgi:uncharacterized protein YjbI with pentapeptide repeats